MGISKATCFFQRRKLGGRSIRREEKDRKQRTPKRLLETQRSSSSNFPHFGSSNGFLFVQSLPGEGRRRKTGGREKREKGKKIGEVFCLPVSHS